MSDALIWIISLAAIFCILIRPREWAEAWWAAGGAGLLLLCGLITFPQALTAMLKGVDVYLFLIGMMILSELAREKGVFDWIAGWAARHANGSPTRLFLLIYLCGMIVTVFLSNDATAVVLTPAVLAIVRRLKVDPRPNLLACAFIANAASFLLPISNPANLVVFARHLPSLEPWLRLFLLPSIAAVSITYFCLRFIFRDALHGRIEETPEIHPLDIEGRLALGGLIAAAALLLAASAWGLSLGIPTCGAALLAVALVAFHDKTVPFKVAGSVSWSIVPLVAGLFVLIEALQGAGMLQLVERGLAAADQWGQIPGNLLTAFSAALLSNGVNNLPVGLAGGAAIQSTATHLGPAFLIGVDLGPNLSVTGSLATLLWLMALRREKVKITGWEFLKVGLLAMPVALLASLLVLEK